MIFTREELGKLSPENLLKLSKYLDIELPKKPKRIEIIDKILERLKPQVDPMVAEVPRYSVRVKRIMESREKEG